MKLNFSLSFIILSSLSFTAVQARIGARKVVDDVVPVPDPDDSEVIVFENDEEPDTERRLMMDMYGELLCNTDAAVSIESQQCLDAAQPFSSLVDAAASNGDNVLVVPCGACYTVDYTDGSTITLPSGGMDVLGRLHFPPTANVVFNTTGVVVQGLLDIPQPLNSGNQVTITLYGTDDVYYYPFDDCNGVYDSSCTARKSVGKKPIAVAGGTVHIEAFDETCSAWSKLKDVSSDSTSFHVDPAFAKCIKAGDAIVLSSEERYSSELSEGTAQYVDITNGIITMTASINRSGGFATEAAMGAEADLAVEVAGLSRSVIFKAQEDDPNPDHGGHMIIFHTPRPQTIEGVKFFNMGQDGILGRYPLHFHMSGDGAGSVVAKNLVVESNQRCYVVHDTNNVVLEGNVAYNTKGHCFITETGNEEGNSFLNNLSIHNKKRNGKIGQSDDPNHTPNKHHASAFWIRNMKNNFVGNVAAGSDIGFWIEMKDKYGIQGDYVFSGNSAHSCSEGLNFYKKGWKPSVPGLIENFKTYKNEEGIKCHICGNFVINNSLIAENQFGMRHGVWNTGVEISNSEFKGFLDDSETRKGRTCPNGLGVRPSYNTHLGGTEKALTFTGVTFSKYTCGKDTIQMYEDGRASNPSMGQNVKMLGTVLDRVDESSKPDIGCGSKNYLEDIDGVLGPSDKGPGFIVNDNDANTAFANCTPISNSCSAFCEGVCMRMVKIKPAHPDSEDLELTSGDITKVFTSGDYTEGFVLNLPAGTYSGRFLDSAGTEVVQDRPQVTFFNTPICNDYITEADFIFQSDAPSGSPTPAPTTSANPTDSPTPLPEYSFVAANTKCPWDGTRIFKYTGVAALSDCHKLCFDQPTCQSFSYYQDDICMGCTASAVYAPEPGVTTYSMNDIQTFDYTLVGKDKKCPWNNRINKLTVANRDECSTLCTNTAGCEIFTFGQENGDTGWSNLCMLCGNVGLSTQTGFNCYTNN